jgi:hypothetical protein
LKKQGVFWIDDYVNGRRQRERIGADKRLAETHTRADRQGVTQPVRRCDAQVTQTASRYTIDKHEFVTDVTLVTQHSRLLLVACLPNQLHQEMLMRSHPGRLAAVDRCAALTTLST